LIIVFIGSGSCIVILFLVLSSLLLCTKAYFAVRVPTCQYSSVFILSAGHQVNCFDELDFEIMAAPIVFKIILVFNI